MALSANARHSWRVGVWRGVVFSGGVLLAVAPFLTWVHRSLGLGADVSFTLNGYSRAALALTVVGAVIAVAALVPGVQMGPWLSLLVLVYAVVALETAGSLVHTVAGGNAGFSLGSGAILAIAGWLLVLVGEFRTRAANRLRGY